MTTTCIAWPTMVAPRMTSLWARVWSKCDIPDDQGACILWRGALSLKRYGERRPVVRQGRRMVAVARVVCEWFHGLPPTPGHQAGHTCPTGENKLCVNPRHLEWQTRYENIGLRTSRSTQARTSTAARTSARTRLDRTIT